MNQSYQAKRQVWAKLAALLFLTALFLAPGRALADAVLFITDGDYVLRYDLNTSTLNPLFINLVSATGVALDASGNLYVGTTGGLPNSGPGVMKYDSFTGAQIGGPFVNYYGTPGGDPRDVISPTGMRFATSGNLAVADTLLSNVHIYDSTGASLGNFTGPSVTQPTDVAFDMAGNLYAVGGGGVSVSAGGFQPFVDFIAPASNPNLVNPVSLAFGPDGKLYVADNNTDKILRYNANGSFDEVFADLDALTGGIFIPSGLDFGLSNNLFVAGQDLIGGDGRVLFFQGDTFGGALITGLASPVDIAFVPEPATWLLPAILGIVLLRRRRGN